MSKMIESEIAASRADFEARASIYRSETAERLQSIADASMVVSKMIGIEFARGEAEKHTFNGAAFCSLLEGKTFDGCLGVLNRLIEVHLARSYYWVKQDKDDDDIPF